jgi:hypothetical protein
MAAHLEAAARDAPVLALLGNQHALRHVEWEPRVGANPTAAELLVRHGVAAFSVLQDWPGQCGDREPVLRKPRHPEGQAAVAEVFAPMAAQPSADPASVADKVVIWGCW